MSYQTWTEESKYRENVTVEKFECDCGRELVVERTECGRCGAHYDCEDGGVIQIAPPISTDSTLYE